MKKNKKIVSLLLATILTLGISMPLNLGSANAENVATFKQELSKSGVTGTKVYVKISRANMRKSYSSKSKLITTLEYGAQAKLIYIVSSNKNLTNAWCYIDYNGQKGYISMKSVTADKATIGEKKGMPISEFKSKLPQLGFNYGYGNTYVYGNDYSKNAAGICTFPNSDSVAIGIGGNYKSNNFKNSLYKCLKLLVPTKSDQIYIKYLRTSQKPKYIVYISDGRMAIVGRDKVNSMKVKLVAITDINF